MGKKHASQYANFGSLLEDPNIQEILESIVDCFKGNESLSSKLQNNLIFVDLVDDKN